MTNHNTKVSGSILSANFLHLERDIKEIESAGIDALHLDIMDGHFVPTISFGPPIVSMIPSITTLPLDVHLMIDSPWLYLEDYINAGMNECSLQIESYDRHIPSHGYASEPSRTATDIDYNAINRDITLLKSNKILTGLTLNPNTEISTLLPIISNVDFILLMSVHPGYSGQQFISSTLEKIQLLRQTYNGDIRVDGGINSSNSKQLKTAGASTLITASYLFGSKNYKTAINALKIN